MRYSVLDTPNLFTEQNGTIAGYCKDRPVFICVDQNVYNIYGKGIEDYFKARVPGARIITVPTGEEHKSMETVLSICKQAKASGIGKDVLFIGIGGGVLTDVVGVVATLYEGGAEYLRISTTLLGDVDAGIAPAAHARTEMGGAQGNQTRRG